MKTLKTELSEYIATGYDFDVGLLFADLLQRKAVQRLKRDLHFHMQKKSYLISYLNYLLQKYGPVLTTLVNMVFNAIQHC